MVWGQGCRFSRTWATRWSRSLIVPSWIIHRLSSSSSASGVHAVDARRGAKRSEVTHDRGNPVLPCPHTLSHSSKLFLRTVELSRCFELSSPIQTHSQYCTSLRHTFKVVLLMLLYVSTEGHSIVSFMVLKHENKSIE